ncbi:hypothetical protein KAR91_18495 [Candidatus Pacearchaeota archaeon]|nr:hypothetical protein [Candidatus Pacearchaeota archaeon]
MDNNSDYVWTKQTNGMYTKAWPVYYKVYGETILHTLEENVSEKEYFLRKLSGES